MARPERMAFGLSLAPSSSEVMGARITPLESSSPAESVVSLLYSSLSLSSVSLLSALALLSFYPGICQCLLASSERTLLLLA